MSSNKYQAKPVFYCHDLQRELSVEEIYTYKKGYYLDRNWKVTKFDSQLEFKVFQILESSYLVKSLEVHPPIQLIPPKTCKCYPNGKNWKVDFIAKNNGGLPSMIVEAKGRVTKEFPLILAMFERSNPKMFEKLWLVFDKIPSNNHLVKHLSKLDVPRVVTVRQLQNLIT